MNFPIHLTDNAKVQLKKLAAQENGAVGIKLSIAQGKGCGGNEYHMEHVFEDVSAMDKFLLGDGVTLYIPISDSFMMFGMIIDFARDNVGNENFIFKNPNEAGRCGCGISFTLDEEKLAQMQENHAKS